MRPGLTAKGSFKNSKSEGIAISYFHHLSEIQGFRIIIFNFIGNYVTGTGTLVKSVPLWNGEKQSRHFFPGKIWTVARASNKGDWISNPSVSAWQEPEDGFLLGAKQAFLHLACPVVPVDIRSSFFFIGRNKRVLDSLTQRVRSLTQFFSNGLSQLRIRYTQPGL